MAEKEKTEEVELRGPGGLSARFRGEDSKNLLRFLSAVCFALILLLGYFLELEMKFDHNSLRASIQEQRDAIQEMTYILTLSQDQREALKLTMPDSLRRRIR